MDTPKWRHYVFSTDSPCWLLIFLHCGSRAISQLANGSLRYSCLHRCLHWDNACCFFPFACICMCTSYIDVVACNAAETPRSDGKAVSCCICVIVQRSTGEWARWLSIRWYISADCCSLGGLVSGSLSFSVCVTADVFVLPLFVCKCSLSVLERQCRDWS